MTDDNKVAAPSAAASQTRTFGTASVRMIAPQSMFELVLAQTGTGRHGSADVRLPAPAANANEPQNSAA
jgi:hypothetical protein